MGDTKEPTEGDTMQPTDGDIMQPTEVDSKQPTEGDTKQPIHLQSPDCPSLSNKQYHHSKSISEPSL